MIQNLFTSVGGWTGVLAGIIEFGNQITPILPPVWAHLLAAILGVIALYNHGTVVTAARVAGVKGV